VKTSTTKYLTGNTYNVCNNNVTVENNVNASPPSSVGEHTYVTIPGLLSYYTGTTHTSHIYNQCKTSNSARPLCFGPKAKGASDGDGDYNTAWFEILHSIPQALSKDSNCSTCFYESTPTGSGNNIFSSTVGKVTGCDSAGIRYQNLSFCSAAANSLLNYNDLDGACEQQNGVSCIVGTGTNYSYTEYTYPIHQYELKSYVFGYCYKGNASGPTQACGTLINNVCPDFSGWNQVWSSKNWWKRTFYSRKSGGDPSVTILKCTPRT
jgi:hypothetical protein